MTRRLPLPLTALLALAGAPGPAAGKVPPDLAGKLRRSASATDTSVLALLHEPGPGGRGYAIRFRFPTYDENIEGWADARAGFGALYLLDPAERSHLPAEVAAAFPNGWIWRGARFTAFAAVRLGRPDLAARAWRALLTRNVVDGQYIPTPPRTATHPFSGPVREMQTSTNCPAQWSRNVIECLALIGDHLPEEPEAPASTGP